MYSVELFGSDPAEENDDCWTGQDFPTLEEAEAFYNQPFSDPKYAQFYKNCTAFITLIGPEVNKKRKNPDFKPRKPEIDSEFARQAGMMGGIDAYNDAR